VSSLSASGLLLGVLIVGAGGVVGGVARFWVAGAVGRRMGEAFPWGTLVVNGTGAVAIGVLAALLATGRLTGGDAASAWLALAIGVLGSYTTVSSFSLQTLALFRQGALGRAGLNVVGSLVVCLGAATAGYVSGLWLWGG
jgi:fluoride exporter